MMAQCGLKKEVLKEVVSVVEKLKVVSGELENPT